MQRAVSFVKEFSYMITRQNKILELIAEGNKVEVSQLSELLGVSKVTIRKDLDHLEEKGLVKREHGFAHLASHDDISGRLAYHYETKRKIAAAAAELVGDGETVMIESGSCCVLLAEALAARQDVTIVTNSAFIASHIRRQPHARTVLFGGAYQNESQVMVGPLAKMCAESFFVDKLFIGTDGFTEKLGFMGADHLRAEMVGVMAGQANKVFVLTESEKFNRLSSVALLPANRVAGVVTDSLLSAGAEAFLTSCGVEIRKVAT